MQEGEASVIVGGTRVRSTESVREARIEVIRRDQNMEPDFEVNLHFADAANLPDPRAQLLEIDVSDRIVAALFTSGLPLKGARVLKLGPVTATFTFDGQRVSVSDYLTSYRTGATGFVPFFVQERGRPWRTMPEDGSPLTLSPGDGLLAGANVYRFEVV